MNNQAIMNYVTLLLLLSYSSIFCLRKSRHEFIPNIKDFLRYMDYNKELENYDFSILDKYDYLFPNNDAFAITINQCIYCPGYLKSFN